MTDYRPFPTTHVVTTCPVTKEQCDRFPRICADSGCQHYSVRRLPLAPNNKSCTDASP